MIWLFIMSVVMISLVWAFVVPIMGEDRPKYTRKYADPFEPIEPNPNDSDLQEIRLSGCLPMEIVKSIARNNNCDMEFDKETGEAILRRRKP